MRGREALAVFAVLMLVAFALVLTLNRLTVQLSVVGVLLAASYPYLKRYTYLPQVYLGLAFGWGIPMAFAACAARCRRWRGCCTCANILWATAYDTWYAMVDRDDDLRAGAKSTAILFGELDLVALGRAVRDVLRGPGAGRAARRAGPVLLGRRRRGGAAGGVRIRHRPPAATARPASARSCTTIGSGLAVFAGIAADLRCGRAHTEIGARSRQNRCVTPAACASR